MALTGPNLPKVPTPLKSIQHYLTIASKHDQRDSVVSYWCRLYALQTGLKLSTKTSEETNFLLKLMDWLEATKKELHDNEAITNDMLYDVLTLFGELSVEAAQNRKYAQWKAAYIHNCLMNGETPVPGPLNETNDENDSNKALNDDDEEAKSNMSPTSPKDNTSLDIPSIPPNPPTTRTQSFESEDDTYKTESGAKLSVEQIGKAQKFIKWASSALDYDDVATSVMNLRNALHLLTTGQEST
ncbi:vacuolar protein sorting-associated protein VTA1 homolog isoform X2 [Mycetomoellerius zeteki]|uniref:vacuolar protein sorting-associated protein VTA1 homolog isoform X2 n=1 Tax=Mycetomoellerius zeteki TaxID=64791 RepID=UPI00084E7D4D|nr:PREDICTED: vacuolar protein sorting-associated protein VTA1 homolog isoform X2 [Trachymyrmex zeteki]